MNIRVPAALLTRPRLLNPLHALRLINPYSQTNSDELLTLQRYARGRKQALEIGSFMGVSAAMIAQVLDRQGSLLCVDPWEPVNGRENPCLSICRRELARKGVLDRVIFLQGYSHEIESEIPDEVDFIFVDGDHSYEAIRRDWKIVMRRLSRQGIVCLHDTTIPSAEPHRDFGAVGFFNEHIRHHPEFEWLECCYSLNVLRRI